MFYVKLIIKNKKTKKEETTESTMFTTKEQAMNIVENYIMKQQGYIDIKMIGNEKIAVIRHDKDVILEILEK